MNTVAITKEYQPLPLSLVQESPDNPRQTFDKTALHELAESIKVEGLHVPIIVRPINDGNSGLALHLCSSRCAVNLHLRAFFACVDDTDDGATSNTLRNTMPCVARLPIFRPCHLVTTSLPAHSNQLCASVKKQASGR